MNNAHYQTADGNENHHELLFRGVFVIKKKKNCLYSFTLCFSIVILKTKKKNLTIFYLKFYCTTMF